MAQYKALVDIDDVDPKIKKDDVIDVSQIPAGAFGRMELVVQKGEVIEDADEDVVVNPSLDELKAEADELGVQYAANISAKTLSERIAAHKAGN